MEFKVEAKELRDVLKVGRAFSRVGAVSGKVEQSIVILQDREHGHYEVHSKRDVASFRYKMKTARAVDRDDLVYALNAESVDKCARQLVDGECIVKTGDRTIVVSQPAIGKVHSIDVSIVPATQHELYLLRCVSSGALVARKNDVMTALTEMATMMMRAPDNRPHNFFYVDVNRKELCASDSHQLMVYRYEGQNVPEDMKLRISINPASVWLMRVIAAFGDELRINVGNGLHLECNDAFGEFNVTNDRTPADWKLLVPGELQFMVQSNVLERIVDMALAQKSRWVRIESLQHSVVALVGQMTGKQFATENTQIRLADPIGSLAGFGVPVYFLLCAARFFAGEDTVTIQFSNDCGPVRFSVSRGAVSKIHYMMPAVMQLPVLPPLMKEMEGIGRSTIEVVPQAKGEPVTAKSLISGDVIEKGSERFLVWWTALDLDLIKLEVLDGKWRRTGKVRTNRLSSYEKTAVFCIPQKRE